MKRLTFTTSMFLKRWDYSLLASSCSHVVVYPSVLENNEPGELQSLIYAHHTTIFALLLEGFVQAETNFKQKDKSK